MQKPKHTMTSREAAALLVSGGTTTDADVANMIADGSILDPDKLTRAHFRRAIGFDFDVVEEKHRFLVKDKATGQTLTVALTDNNDVNASKLSKAVMKLKRIHDKQQQLSDVVEGEVV